MLARVPAQSVRKVSHHNYFLLPAIRTTALCIRANYSGTSL
jgi:hypothetical protein